MIAECNHILSSGKKCRCAATRNQEFCRHHGPKAAVAGPPLPKYCGNPAHAKWRALGRNLHWLCPSEIPFTIHHILASMLLARPYRLSDLVAGRYLRLLLQRHGTVPFPVPDPAVGTPRQRPVSVESYFPPEVRSAMDAICENTNSENAKKLLAAFEKSGIVTAEMLARDYPAPPPSTVLSGPQLLRS